MAVILSGSENGASSWFRWLAPSFADLLFIGLLVLLTTNGFSSKLLGDAGIGWHIRNGERIVQSHSIPDTDSFSATMSGQKWYAWEWLYDAGIAEVHTRTGLNGVVFFTAFVIALTFAAALKVSVKNGSSLPIAVLLLALSISSSTIHFLTRPHVLSWLFAVIWFAILDRSIDNKYRHRLYCLPVSMVLWVNLHGGFLVGLVILAIYLIEAFVDRSKREAAGSWELLTKITAWSGLATLMNPRGVFLYVHIVRYLNDGFLMSHIQEFQSPNFHGLAQKCFAILLLVAMAALAVNTQKLRTAHWFLILFAVYSGLYSSRNLPVSSLLLALIIAPIISREIADAGRRSQVLPSLRKILVRFDGFASTLTAMESQFRGHLWPILGLIIGATVCLNGGALGSRQILNAHFSEKRFPVKAIDSISKMDSREPIFAPDYWGGYLIYRLYPERKAFVDDRHDFYGSDFFRQYLTTVHVEPGWDDLLTQLQAHWVLVPEGSPLANILKEDKRWTVVNEDETAVLLHKL
jgi:hypothetical protein